MLCMGFFEQTYMATDACEPTRIDLQSIKASSHED